MTESETDIVTETDLTEVSETTFAIDEVQFYAESTEIQLNKVSETDSSISLVGNIVCKWRTVGDRKKLQSWNSRFV